jgi:hypothetical protein
MKKFGRFHALVQNVSRNFCPLTVPLKSYVPPVCADGSKSPRPQSMVLRKPPNCPNRVPCRQPVPRTEQVRSKAVTGVLQGWAADAARAQRKSLPTVARPAPAPGRENAGSRQEKSSRRLCICASLFVRRTGARHDPPPPRLRASVPLERSLHLSLRSGARAPPPRHQSSCSRDPCGMPAPPWRAQNPVTVLPPFRCAGAGG